MKMRNFVTVTAATALALGATLASAQVIEKTVVGDQIIITEIRTAPTSGIHTGAMTWDDLVLVEKVAQALESDRRLANGLTATLVAKNGQVTLSGSTSNYAQAQLAELRAKQAASPSSVVGTIATSGG